MGCVVLDAGQGRGGRGGGATGGGQWAVGREVDSRKPNNAKIPGGVVSYLELRKQSTNCNRPGEEVS